jgi:integrase
MAIYLRGKSYYYDFVHKGQRYTGCIGPVSRTVAKEEEHRKKTEVIEHRLNPAKARKSPRFDTFAEEYLEWVKTNRKPLTYTKTAVVMANMAPFFGSKKLSDLTAWHIEQYKKARKEAGRASSTINVELGFLNAMLHRAQTWGKLTVHPGKEVKPFKEVQHRIRFLDEEEEARVLALSSPSLRRIVQAGLLTGFRRQELTSLRPEDVDLTRETVSVAACYAKNGESRTLPVSPRLRAILQEALETRGNAATVFVTRRGDPWTPGWFADAFRRAARRAGIGNLGPHVLRHTFASRLVMSGVDLKTTQELLGHKNILMTMKYAHLSPHHKRQAMEALEARFPGKSPSNFHNTPATAVPAAAKKVVNIR